MGSERKFVNIVNLKSLQWNKVFKFGEWAVEVTVKKLSFGRSASRVKSIVALVILVIVLATLPVCIAGVIYTNTFSKSLEMAKDSLDEMSSSSVYRISIDGVSVYRSLNDSGHAVYVVRTGDSMEGCIMLVGNSCYIKAGGLTSKDAARYEWVRVDASDFEVSVVDTRLDIQSMLNEGKLKQIGKGFAGFVDSVKDIFGGGAYGIKRMSGSVRVEGDSRAATGEVEFHKTDGIRVIPDGVFSSGSVSCIEIFYSGRLEAETQDGLLEFSTVDIGSNFKYVEKTIQALSYDLQLDDEKYGKMKKAYSNGKTIFESLREALN